MFIAGDKVLVRHTDGENKTAYFPGVVEKPCDDAHLLKLLEMDKGWWVKLTTYGLMIVFSEANMTKIEDEQP